MGSNALMAAIAAAVEIDVMIDSGFRRGSDVLKAIALGARFVFVGRPFNYAAAVAGEAGVEHAIGILATEVHRNLGMLGIDSLDEMTADRLYAHAGASCSRAWALCSPAGAFCSRAGARGSQA